MGVRFLHKVNTSSDRTIFVGITIALVIFLVFAIFLLPLVLGSERNLPGPLLIVLQLGIIVVPLGFYGFLFFTHFLPILRSKRGWEFRLQEGHLTIQTPIPSSGEELDTAVEAIVAVIYESPKSQHRQGNWCLEFSEGDRYRIPQGGGLKITQLARAILKANPGVERRTESFWKKTSHGPGSDWPKEWPAVFS